jgi:hypothetical protein
VKLKVPLAYMIVGADPLIAARNSGTVVTVTVLLPFWSPPVVGPSGLSLAKPIKSKPEPVGAADAASAKAKTDRIENFILNDVASKQTWESTQSAGSHSSFIKAQNFHSTPNAKTLAHRYVIMLACISSGLPTGD